MTENEENKGQEDSLLSQILSSTDSAPDNTNQNIENNINNSGSETVTSPLPPDNNQKTKKQTAKKQDFAKIFGAIFLVSVIFFGTFLAYIVFNPGQAQFFLSLGISPQDIKSLLEKLVNISFGAFTFAFSIIWIIFLFKAILTKKEYKKKKTIAIIASAFTGIILFSGITLWIFLIQQIGYTDYANPNGGIIVYDNDKFISDKFKDNSEVYDLTNLIGPITLRFDFKSNADHISKELKIESFDIDFDGDNKIDKSGTNPRDEEAIIFKYDKAGNYKPKGVYRGIDVLTGKEKEINMVLSEINIIGTVDIVFKQQRLGGYISTFDATSLKNIGRIKWYTQTSENEGKPAKESYKFEVISKTGEQELVCLSIINSKKSGEICDRVFIVNGENNSENISGVINYEQDPENPLILKFMIGEIRNKDKIASYKWTADDSNLIGEEENPEYTFSNFGAHTVKVILTDNLGGTSEIKSSIILRKPLTLIRPIQTGEVNDNNSMLKIQKEDKTSVIDNTYKREIKAYYIEIGIPAKLTFNANLIAVNDPTYDLKNVEWDFNGDKKFEKIGEVVEKDLIESKKYTITVQYTFESKLKNNTEKLTETIIINGIKKEIDTKLKITSDSSYAPTIVHFDGSASEVREGSIAKYTYDFGDGKPSIDSDAKIDYKYNFPGEFTVKLTVTKDDGTKESLEKKIILKGISKKLIINSSLSSGTVGNSIDFDTVGSTGVIESYSWDFGDGSSSSEINPSHAYSNTGTYKIKLTAVYNDGTVQTEEKEIIIKE
ncbi:PKD domain-containing protein [Candidatus Gracilibacteria bacterium]|nr:PKD domain-containing protein [Candidatus Gracilibacteria bacterium]